MCVRFTYLTKDEVEDVIKELESFSPLNVMPDWPAVRPSAYPKSRVPIIQPDEQGRLFPKELEWGFRFEWQKEVVFNTRLESWAKPTWKDSILHRRCVVPAFSFFEPHKTEKSLSPRTRNPIKRPYEFRMPSGSVMLMAGLWKGDRFSIITTEPNESVARIHNRMPLVLEPGEVKTWFGPDFLKLGDRASISLQATPELPLAT